MSFGTDLSQEFRKLTQNVKFDEVCLFTKLQDAFINLKSSNPTYQYAIDIIHGHKSHVDFHFNSTWVSTTPYGTSVTRELADMMFVIYSHQQHQIRVTYMQNKRGVSDSKFRADLTKELYCLEPRIFHKLKDIQERSLLAFLKLLLSSEERENVLTAVEQIVQLTTEQRTQFASILKKTHLENIIDTIAFVENRYRIIEILKRIIFDLGNYANERDHIQKIVEQNYWLFGEQFNLASADKTMHRALEQYNYLLYGAKNATQPLPQEAEAERRMDIFLCNSRNVETAFGSYIEENIIVELKAPTVRLNKTVLRQIEDYMDYIRDHAQFNSSQRRWKFIAVCKEVDDHVKAQYDTFKDRGKPGLVYQSGNYEIYAYTWSDVFTSFDLRHSFMLNKLKYDRNVIVEELKKDHPDQSRDTVNALRDISIAN